MSGLPLALGRSRPAKRSKATNVASAAVGIRSFDSGVHLILGGSEKGEPYAPLLDPIREHCAGCYLTGETSARMAAELAPAADAGVPIELRSDLEDAVLRAASLAKSGEVVLLSPACASFDAFDNFERRGERFREIVEGLR